MDSESPMYQLSVWQPSTFGLDILSFFGPLHVLILYLYPVALESLTLIGCLTFQCLLLVNLYGQAVRDRQLLHGQLLREYDTQFVYPTIVKMKDFEATLKLKQAQEELEATSPKRDSLPYSPSSAKLVRALTTSPLSGYQKKEQSDTLSKEHTRTSPRRNARK